MEVVDVVFGDFGWVVVFVYCGVFGWQIKGVLVYWMQYVVFCYVFVVGDDVGCCIVFGMVDVKFGV